jgi:hypothetical protein
MRLQQAWFGSLVEKSNNDLSRAQFVPNTARNWGHSRLAMVSVYPLHVTESPNQSSKGSSSKLVIRVGQAVRDGEAARPPRVAVALHSDPWRRRSDLGDPRE